MKKTFSLILIFSSLILPRFAHADITTGLVDWWKFDEGSAITAIDSGSNSNNGSEISTPSYVAGKIGRYALQFNGSSNYVDIPMTVSYSTITVSAWIQSTNVSAGDNPRIVSNSHTDTDDKGFQLMYNNGGASGFFDVSNGSSEGRATWSQSLANGTWYFYTGVYDGSHVYAYINGVQVASTSYSGGALAASGVDVNIARNQAYAGDYFAGTVDDVRIYNRALSQADVTQLYAYTGVSGMFSSNYQINFDAVDSGGVRSSSGNYIAEDTVGESATGVSNSANYTVSAGYQMMNQSYISISSQPNVVMPSISGLGAHTSTSSLAWTVVTDDAAGYALYTQATSSPALASTSGAYFADYAPSGGNPDYTFAIGAASSSFGFSPFGTDTASRFKNNGAACNTGFSITLYKCWDGFSTSQKLIAQGASSNQPLGTQTSLTIEAQVGSNKNQDSGTYQATIVTTAISL